MSEPYTERDRANEGCCWDYMRQLCPGNGCLCNCHATNEEILLSDRAKLRYANTRQTDRIAALTAENAALRVRAEAANQWQRIAERLAWHLSDQLHVAKFRFKAGGYGPASSYGDDGTQALVDFRSMSPEGMKLPRDYEGRENCG